MGMYIRHKLIESDEGIVLVLYIDPMLTEFAEELGHGDSPNKRETLRESVSSYIRENLPGVRVNSVRIMLGTMLLTTMLVAGPLVTEAKAATTGTTSTQSVSQGIRVTINGTPATFSRAPVPRNGTTYVPVRELAEKLGGSVWWNDTSKTVGVNKGDTRIAFVVGAGTARVNGISVPMQPSYIDNGTTMVPVRFLAESMGMNVGWNGTTNTVSITQKGTAGVGVPSGNYVTYNTYTVQSGDNIWNLSIRFGIPQAELLKANNLTTSSMLSIGQKLTIPVHHIGVQATMGERYGEYLDWWSEAQYVFSINQVATVTDFATGRSFQVKRTIGANHSDTEPLTATDAATIKQIWGGAYSWSERAVIVRVGDRKIAASMASMPHGVDYVGNNNFAGHFDIHFRNSTRHVDGAVSEAHQRQVAIAAGLTGT